jgi:DNA-binding CsgD family transcriptional regulator
VRDRKSVYLEAGGALLDPDGLIIKASPAFALFIGKKANELKGQALGDLLRLPGKRAASDRRWIDLNTPSSGICFAGQGRSFTEFIYSLDRDLVPDGLILTIYPLPDRKTIAKVLGHVAENEGISVDLTSREREILDLVSRGYTNGDIAEQVDLSPDTVKSHLSNIRGKLGVHSRSQAVAVAMRCGVIY